MQFYYFTFLSHSCRIFYLRFGCFFFALVRSRFLLASSGIRSRETRFFTVRIINYFAKIDERLENTMKVWSRYRFRHPSSIIIAVKHIPSVESSVAPIYNSTRICLSFPLFGSLDLYIYI